MKRSTRFLALLLCLVMMASLMPTMAFADEVGTTVVDNKGVGEKIITLSKDRYTVKTGNEIGYVDSGYGYETTYMFPKGNGGTAYTFQIHRDQAGTGKETDLNRWWRWAKEGDVLNQRQSDTESGYDKHNGTPGVDGWTAKVVYRDDGKADGELKGDEVTVVKDGTRVQSYILMKPLLMPRPYCFLWTGGNRTRSANVSVTIDTTKDLGTSAILWSANGTDSKHFGNFLKTHKIETDRRVHYGDLGQNYMVIIESRTVTYKLDGGTINNPDKKNPAIENDPNDQQYVVWTTGTASTSQKHKVITAVPEKAGMTFNGWYCKELNKMVTAGTDLNNGITQNMTLEAQWVPDVNDPDYMVHFNGNGETSGSMKDQGFKIDMPQNLNLNQFVQTYTINYNGNKGTSERASEDVNSDFRGWTKVGGQQANVDYTDGQEVVNLVPSRTDPVSTVDLYAQWTPGTVILPGAFRDVTEDDADDDIVEWMFEGWYTKPGADGKFVGMDGAQYKLTQDGETLYAHWKAIKEDVFYICHSSTGQIEAVSMKGLINRNTYKEKDSEGVWRDNSYITGYTNTMYDITKETESGYLYGGTFADENYTQVADFRGLYDVVTTKYVAFVGTTADKVTPTYTAAGTPTAFHPQSGKTYYIWEVSEEHLVPKNISVWSKQNGIIDVKAVYLLTAIDRLNYSAAGFQISAGEVNQVSNEGKIAYDYITVWQNNQDYRYIDLYSAATTTANSKIQCCALTGFKDQPINVVPYWVTLDGVKVFGTTQRTITYLGEGHNAVDVKDAPYTGTRIVANGVMSAAPAPMMLMARYSMVNEENFVDVGNLPETPEEPETAVVNVVDGENAYEAEIVDGAVALTPAGADGKLFAGWFVDAAFTAPADLAAVNDGDTVYAKYVSANFLKVKYAAVFTLFNKSVSLTAAVADKNFTETGFVIETKNGTDTVVVSSYAAKFALQNAQQLFGVAKGAPLMSVDYKLSGLSKGDTITVTPYWVTADGTTVYGTARTLTYTGLTVKG